MKSRYLIIISILALVLLLGGGFMVVKKVLSPSAPTPTPTPTEEPIQQLTSDQYPKISLQFSADAHYVTVNISNLHAGALEYNLIYDAVVKGNKINTGVNASQKLEGKTDYSKQQLLGSESSGHFTYHTNISNATLELTLRDDSGRSIFDSTYPFTVTPGKTQELQPQS